MDMELEAIRVMAQQMQDILGLSASVIGVSFRVDGKTRADRPLKVELLGLDCAECEGLEQQLLRVLGGLDLAAEILVTGDSTAFSLYGLQQLPAIAIDGQLALQGQAPSDALLHNIFRAYQGQNQ
jgi:hypothetical protein